MTQSQSLLKCIQLYILSCGESSPISLIELQCGRRQAHLPFAFWYTGVESSAWVWLKSQCIIKYSLIAVFLKSILLSFSRSSNSENKWVYLFCVHIVLIKLTLVFKNNVEQRGRHLFSNGLTVFLAAQKQCPFFRMLLPVVCLFLNLQISMKRSKWRLLFSLIQPVLMGDPGSNS